MYMHGHNPNQLDGFNPLKAIGRALGSTGRAIVGAVVPGVGGAVSSILDTAARGGSSAASSTPTAQVTSLTAPSTAASNLPAAKDSGLNTQVVDLVKTLIENQNKQPAAPAPAPVVVSAGGAPVPTFIPTPSAPAAAALPSWALPAAIAGIAALFFATSKRR